MAVTPHTDRVPLSELLDDVLRDYKVNGRRSLKTVTDYIDGICGRTSAPARPSVTTADVART